MKVIEAITNLIFIVVILVVIYLLYKFLSNPLGSMSAKVPSKFTAGKEDRLLFGFINLDEGFAGSKTILNKISGGRLFPTVDQQRADDVGIRLPRMGETQFTFGGNPPPTLRTQQFIDANKDGIDDRDTAPYRLRFR